MRVAITAAEASGDRAAGALATELRRLDPTIEIYGSGGKYLEAAGAKLVVDSSGLGVVGIASALASLPKLLAARSRLLTALKQRPPDVLVPIDAGAFHLGFGLIEGLCPWVRRKLPNTRICYYFPPGSWRRTLKYTSLNKLADCVATPFSWNETELRRLGANAHFVGHPLLDSVRPQLDFAMFCEKFGLDPDKPIIGLLPGSRVQEIEAILPTQLAAAVKIAERIPGVQFVLALAATVDRALIEAALNAARSQSIHHFEAPKKITDPLTLEIVPATGVLGDPRQKAWLTAATQRPEPIGFPPIVLVSDATYDVMAHSDALICTSGTATLEALILTKPMVIVYKMHRANLIEYQFIKNKLPEFVGMPNLLAEKRLCPELLQDAATPDAIATEIIGLLLDPPRMHALKQSLGALKQSLGEPGGARRTAELILALGQKA
jgi:lipid-A-disaccharide synthase